MRIRITTTFTDKQATDPDQAEIAAGTEITVTAERGAELVALGLAVDLAVVDKPARRGRRPRAKPAVTPSSTAPSPVPSAPPLPAAEASPAPIAAPSEQ